MLKLQLKHIIALIHLCIALPLCASEPCVDFTLRVVTSNQTAGEVVIIQQSSCDNGNTAIVEAKANSGYRFVSWTDGNTDNPRTITLTRDWTLIATWEEKPCVDYSLIAISTYDVAGSVEITQTPSCENNNTAIVTATANEGYVFNGWTDGNTDNPRTLHLTDNQRIFATWTRQPCDTFQLQLNANDTNYGVCTVLQEPTCETKNTAVISAIANDGYNFVIWSDGNTMSTRVLTLTQDTTLTAIFEQQICFVIATPNNSEFGNVLGTGTYNYGMDVTITAYPAAGYIFDSWDDGNTENPRIVNIKGDISLTAIFKAEYHEIRVVSDNEAMGSVSGSGTYQDNSYATISAQPNTGYRFTHWDDNSTEATRNVLVLRDATYTAYFSPNTDIELTAIEGISIDGLTIILPQSNGTNLSVVAPNGKLIYNGPMIEQLTMPAHGVYIIRIDDKSARIIL